MGRNRPIGYSLDFRHRIEVRFEIHNFFFAIRKISDYLKETKLTKENRIQVKSIFLKLKFTIKFDHII